MNRREAIDEVRAKFSGLSDYLLGGYLHETREMHAVDIVEEDQESEEVADLVNALDALQNYLNVQEEIELKKENDTLPADPFAGANTGE